MADCGDEYGQVGLVGDIRLVNYPEATEAEKRAYRKQLREAEARKAPLGFYTHQTKRRPT